jgi:tRNA-specific 2-thiouridylase
VTLDGMTWAGSAAAGEVGAQCSAHGAVRPATVEPGPVGRAVVRFARPERRVATGQAVVLYDGDEVVGGGLAT